jgi:hypothetical protein
MKASMGASLRAGLDKILGDPWNPCEWERDYPLDANMLTRLQKLEAAFPAAWRQKQIARAPVIVHPLASDLLWRLSRARLLALADVLSYKAQKRNTPREIWMGGKLRDPRQYGPTGP